MCLGSALCVANSFLHGAGNLLGGAAWQIIAGVGIYTAYQNTPVYERLVALSGSKGTCTFLVFLSDMMVYFGTSVLVLWKVFFSSEENNAADYYDKIAYGTMLPSTLFLGGAILVVLKYYVDREGTLAGSETLDDVRYDSIHGISANGQLSI